MSNLDLNNLLEGWPHEPGQVKARKILGRDGREKVQLRIDLGLIQMEVSGRPDGQRPFGFESLLHYHRAKAEASSTTGDQYLLGESDVVSLQQESVQYYHRYLSLFQLHDYKNVVRDTDRNLELFDFVSKYCPDENARWALEQFRPYVIMMNTRARASLELQNGRSGTAVRLIESGKGKIESFYRSIGQAEWMETSNELSFLNDWLKELNDTLPLTPLQILERDLQRAIVDEAYEKAAELRDAIRTLRLSEKLPDESVDR